MGLWRKLKIKKRESKRKKKRKKNKKQGRGNWQKANRKQFCDTWKDTFNKREHFYVSFMRGWRHGELWVFPIHTERLSCSFIQIQWQSLLMNIDNNHANQKTHAVFFFCFTWNLLKMTVCVFDLLKEKHNGRTCLNIFRGACYKIYNWDVKCIFLIFFLEKKKKVYQASSLTFSSEWYGGRLSLTAGQESPSHLCLIWEALGLGWGMRESWRQGRMKNEGVTALLQG